MKHRYPDKVLWQQSVFVVWAWDLEHGSFVELMFLRQDEVDVRLEKWSWNTWVVFQKRERLL